MSGRKERFWTLARTSSCCLMQPLLVSVRRSGFCKSWITRG